MIVGDDQKVCNENRLLVVFVVLVLVISVASLSKDVRVKAVSEIYVSPTQSIQGAINSAADGDTIIVENGVHVEGQYPIVVNKSITLKGQNTAETVIDGNGSSVGVLLVRVDGVRVLNLTIQNTTQDYYVAGISLTNMKSAEVADCVLTNCGTGLMMTNSSGNNITRNNIVDDKSYGVYLHVGSSFNLILDNNVTRNPTGIIFADVSCQNNTIYHNSFVDNVNQESGLGTATRWDDGYPSGGNYWSDHTNEDLFSGSGQNLTGSDGIADVSYRDLDEYPLAEPVYVFYMYGWNSIDYYVLASSNSTVHDFEFDPGAGSFLTLKASGSEGTVGCCRVILPKSILWVGEGESWTVTVNGTALVASPLVLEDANSTFLFISYSHSTEVIRIAGTHVVPEYGLLVLLFFSVSLVGASFFVRKVGKGLKLSG